MKDEPTGIAARLARRTRALSLRSKLMLVIAGVSLTVAAAAMLASIAIELSFFRARLLEEYQASARMLASNLEAAVAFEDARDSQDVLSALAERAHVESAAVYLGDGALLASYRRNDAPADARPPAFGETTGERANKLTVSAPIAVDGQLVGQVVLRVELAELRTFLSARALVFGILLAGAAALCFALAARFGRMISRPIRDLAATARRIAAQRDFSVRHERVAESETGQLVDAFNEMMEEIERRNAELERAKEAAEASSRAKDDFLSVISHELRTPMNPIIGYTQVLLKKPRDPDDARHLTLIRRSAEHLLGLIDDILDYSRFERGVAALVKDSVDYRSVCRDAIALLAPEAKEKGIALEESHEIDSPELRGRALRILVDEIKFRQIALNFLSNAIKFTEAGTVSLRTRLSGGPDESKRLRLEVVDTGIGIAKADRDKIFKPFSQIGASLTRSHSGMGLGLAISRKIVEAIGGAIGFESEKGSGSRFWFDIPVTVDLSEPEAPRSPPPRSQIAPGKRVLLVDDQLINRELARGLIAERGLEVVCAKDGIEALDIAAEQEFDLVILDVKMPRMDGYEAARALRKREAESGKRRVPIVAMTAHITTRGSRDSIDSGMDDFIAKPFDLEKLDAILEKWLA